MSGHGGQGSVSVQRAAHCEAAAGLIPGWRGGGSRRVMGVEAGGDAEWGVPENEGRADDEEELGNTAE